MLLSSNPSVIFEVIRETLARDDNLLTVSLLCDIACVSRAGYYKWLGNAENRELYDQKDWADYQLIREAYSFRNFDKGAVGIHMRLLHYDPPVVMNPKKIRRLMRKYRLKCPIRVANPYHKMAKATQVGKVAPNILDRKFRTSGARAVLLTDITYIPRGEGKYTYLQVIMDAYTKEVLAWVCSLSFDVDFVKASVEQLLASHGNELKTDALVHSDQGAHYTSHAFRDILSDASLRQSMSRRGNCWDNAPQESFVGL